MAAFHERALEIAAALPSRGIDVFPEPPHTNAFRIFAPVAEAVAMQRLMAFMEDEKTALTPPWMPSEVPGWSWTELTVGQSTLEWDVDEAADVLARVLLDRDA
jgi:hypothetical protein